MNDDILIRENSLIHGHDTNVEILKMEDKFLDLAVMLATNSDYDKRDFLVRSCRSRVVLKDSKMFLKEKLVLHKIAYTDERLLKLKLHGRLVKNEKDVINLYNKVGIMIDPFSLPVKFVLQPSYYGNLSLLANLSDDEMFLNNMKLFFKKIELSSNINQITSVCYTHEIIHTQLESLKGIVRDYYNSELLSIFFELLYSYEKDKDVYYETVKNRINMFLLEVDKLFKYIQESEVSEGKWDTVIGCKYIVSTLKAINLFNMYVDGNNNTKKYILSLIQNVFDGNYTLEEMLEKINVYYENSIDNDKVLKLIYR